MYSKLHYNFIIPLLLDLVLSGNAISQNKLDDKEYPKNTVRVNFKENKQDSLKKITDFDTFANDSTKNVIGYISSINFNSDYIYLADHQQDKVFVLSRKTFKYLFTIGNGLGKSPIDLNKPFGLQILQDKLMVPQRTGQFLVSFYSFDGKFINSIARKSFDYNGSLDMSLILKDSTVYTTIGIARNHKKVQVFNLDNQDKVNEILAISDFHSKVDSLNFSKILPCLYLSKSTKDSSIFYAVPSNKPLVNVYKLNGKLLKSYDLRSIPILNTYYKQYKNLFQDKVDSRLNYNYFINVINDENDNLIFGCQKILNLQKITDDFKGLDDPNNVRNYYVFVNLNTKTYKLFKCDFAVKPMKVIDDNLWCFDMNKSRIVVYKLPN